MKTEAENRVTLPQAGDTNHCGQEPETRRKHGRRKGARHGQEHSGIDPKKKKGWRAFKLLSRWRPGRGEVSWPSKFGGIGFEVGGEQKVTSCDRLITRKLIVPPRSKVGIFQQNPATF